MPESRRGRLPEEVYPKCYRIHLMVRPEARSFSGTVSIDLQIDTPVQSLILHALDLKIGQAALAQMKADVAVDSFSEVITLSFPKNNSVGP